MKRQIETLMNQNERISSAYEALASQTNAKVEEATRLLRHELNQINTDLMQRLYNAEALMKESKTRAPGSQSSIKLIDTKTMTPSNFSGKHRENWKEFSRKFKAYCDGKCSGFKQALNWAELQKSEIKPEDVQHLNWQHAEEADAALTNLLLQVTTDEPNCIVDQLGERGFEAWRQLVARYDPYDDTNELQRITELMSVKRSKSMREVPDAVAQWEREMRTYCERTGFGIPETWKIKILFSMMPSTYEDQLKMHYVRSDKESRKYDTVRRMILDYAHANTGVATPMDVGAIGQEEMSSNQYTDQEWIDYYEWGEQSLDALQKAGKSNGLKGGKGKGKNKGYTSAYGGGKGYLNAYGGKGGKGKDAGEAGQADWTNGPKGNGKIKGKCHNCKKIGHTASVCKAPKNKGTASLEDQENEEEYDAENEFGSLEIVAGKPGDRARSRLECCV